jgi:hypothetical protein
MEASSECVEIPVPWQHTISFVLLDCTLSDADARGKGFHEVVLAPLRLASVSDILLETEEG